jgi:hypothetical protein
MKFTYLLHLRTPKSPSAKRWEVPSIKAGREKADKVRAPANSEFWIGCYLDGVLYKTYPA